MVDLMAVAPRDILGLEPVKIAEGSVADITVFDPSVEWTVAVDDFCSKAHNSGFVGCALKGPRDRRVRWWRSNALRRRYRRIANMCAGAIVARSRMIYRARMRLCPRLYYEVKGFSMCECEAHNGTPAFEERACVVSNENLGPRLYKITLAAPKTAAAIRPGQFVHMLLPGFGAHILRRPFSVYAAKGDNVEIIYQTVGEGTAYLTEVETGAVCSLISPLGHGWQPSEGKKPHRGRWRGRRAFVHVHRAARARRPRGRSCAWCPNCQHDGDA